MSRIIIEGKTYRFNNIEIAKLLECHRLTIANVLNRGESHPRYKKVITAIVNKNREAKVLSNINHLK